MRNALPRRSSWALLIVLFIVVIGWLVFTASVSAAPAHETTATATTDFAKLCETVLMRALEVTEADCSPTGRNQACYGYTVVQSELQSGISPASIRFARSGDIVPIRSLAKIRTEPLNLVQGTWGMAVLRLQANLPDTNPGQNITFILFGDTTLQPDSSRTNAFYLSTELGNLVCKQIPQNSVLVRSPNHVAVKFAMNGVDITASSVVVLRASSGGGLLVRAMEGHVGVTANGITQTLFAGQELSVPLGGANGLVAIGPPSTPISAPLETALHSTLHMANKLTDTDVYEGSIVIEGIVEAINTKIPAISIYGQLILLNGSMDWKRVRPGQWARVEGVIVDSVLYGKTLRLRDVAPTRTPTSTATSLPSATAQPYIPPADSSSGQPGNPPAQPTATLNPNEIEMTRIAEMTQNAPPPTSTPIPPNTPNPNELELTKRAANSAPNPVPGVCTTC
jgi:hypothetical protein